MPFAAAQLWLSSAGSAAAAHVPSCWASCLTRAWTTSSALEVRAVLCCAVLPVTLRLITMFTHHPLRPAQAQCFPFLLPRLYMW